MADEKLGEIEEEVLRDVRSPPPQGLINKGREEHLVNEPPKFSVRFQVIATLVIVVLALAGGGVGVLLNMEAVNKDVVSWVGLPGDLFIRALKCVVLPLIFVNVILAVVQMIEAGKAGAVGMYTVLIYLLTTLIASIEGLVAVVVFQDRFSRPVLTEPKTFVQIQCDATDTNNGPLFLSVGDFDVDSSSAPLSCISESAIQGNETNFEINNVNGFFVTAEEEFTVFSFSETLQNGIFKKLIPDNIVAEFANGGFVGVVMFGIIFGAASQALTRKPVLLIEFLEDVNDIFVKIIQWIIYLTPIAVFSLIAGALAGQGDLATVFKDVGFLVLASCCAIVAHIFIVYPLLFFVFTRRNPYAYLRYIIPAQIFAFACASSAATLPVTLRCVKETGQVPDSVRDFVLPIGATINMDGTALYFPPALVFLAVTGGLPVDAADYFLIILVSTIGSAGAAPVPNAGLVLIVSAFNTVFGGDGPPANFAIIVGIDWLMDRFQTALNITGDAMVSRIVTHLAGLNVNKDQPTSELIVEAEASA